MKHHITALLLSVLSLFMFSISVYAQLPSDPFEAYANNPVLPKSPGDWDEGEVFWPTVTFVNDSFYMVYNGTNDISNSPLQLGLATSSNGYNYIKSYSNPIFSPDGTGFDALTVQQGVLFFDNSTWYLYYAGHSSSLNPGNVIGRAVSSVSPHGPWIRSEDTLLAVGSSGEWDSQIISPESIVKNGSELVMYYWGCNIWPGNPQIGMATSTDGGMTWEKYNDPSTNTPPYLNSDPVLKPDKSYDMCGIFGCTVFKLADSWEMYYSGKIIGCDTVSICYATSIDGIIWNKYNGNPIFSANQDPVSTIFLEKPALVKFDSIYFMYYDYGIGPYNLGIGLATASDTTNTYVKILSDNIPSSFSLRQNFPNPFNPVTTIQFSLPTPEFVNLSIYNSLGEQLENLISEYLPAGDYKYNWNANFLPSGVYFYRLQAQEFVEIKKMVLMK